MTTLKSPDMSADEFRKWGYRFVDWVADYLGNPDRLSVLSQVKPGDIRKQLPPLPPNDPESMELVLRDLDKIIVPGVTHWNHPGFFAYFPNTGSGAGILGELLSAAFNTNGMLWRTSPAATELEEHVLDWLRQMLGMPDVFKGMVYDTASISTFHALAAARETIAGRNVREDGIAGPDAPHAGAAAIAPEMRHILDGCERADSLVTNPHKWMLTPMDFSAFFCRRPDMLKRAFSLTPEFLKTAEVDVTNAMDYTLQLGRRFRALKLWMIIRYFGVEGLRAVVREHIRLAKLFASLVESDPRFEIAAPAPFSTVCFRLKSGDAANQALLDRVN